MIEKIVVPKFATEAEEAAWWFENREEHGKFMAQEMAAGRTIKMKDLLAARGLQGPRVSVEFEFDDVVKAREQAQQRGVAVEAYLRELVHEAVTKNAAA
jgi:hypothetical protein